MKKDSLYFQAIAEAAAGRLDIEVLESSLYKGRRAVNREEYSLAARYFEGVFQVWEIYVAAEKKEDVGMHREFIRPALSDYASTLTQLRRTQRLQDVQAALDRIKGPETR
ncbi:MAG: hypothetical protein K2W95_33035 [Candidatus Obscuribacterales bacterium]|nr:hypothetical protein [Candidatus Obscuribacterales bacterium]